MWIKAKRYKILFLAIIGLLLPVYALAGNFIGQVKVQGLRSPANVLVYVAKGPVPAATVSAATVVMDQKDLTFRPHVLPLTVGTAVQFPNNDKLDHNVFSMSRAQKFNLGSYKPGQTKTVVFGKPGLVEVRCDVHAEMLAYIVVLKNGYWALTDKKGRFSIPAINGGPALGAGEYVIRTWHPKLKSSKQVLTITDGVDAGPLDISLRRGRPGALYK